jgi:CRP-like cAMP-binding protein
LESLQAGEQPLVAGPGDAVGIYETLAGGESGAIGRDPLRLVVARAGTGLRIERDDLFDLLRQYPDLLQQLFASLFRTTGRTGATATVEV